MLRCRKWSLLLVLLIAALLTPIQQGRAEDRVIVRGNYYRETSTRVLQPMVTFRKELLHLAHACGRAHPGIVPLDMVAILDDRLGHRPAREVFDYQPGWGLPRAEEIEATIALMGPGGARAKELA